MLVVWMVKEMLTARPLSILSAVLVSVAWASLAGLSPLLVVAGWLVQSIAWVALAGPVEPWLARARGARLPTPEERRRLALARIGGALLVEDADTPRVRVGLSSAVVSRGAFDLLDDASLAALLVQGRRASSPADLAARLSWGVPLALDLLARVVMGAGRLLAVDLAVGLVIPAVAWDQDRSLGPAGRALGVLLVGATGCLLAASGFGGWGLAFVLGSPVAAGLRWLLAWEAGRADLRADASTVEAGLGWPLLEALERLAALGGPAAGGLAARIGRLRARLA